MNGLDLFSGIGGLTLALQEWISPIAYCEIDPYCQGVLASRMSECKLPVAPIWDDVRTLTASVLPKEIDIIYGGFPCQDISVAGRGEGLEGKRSGLFYEIVRLAEEIKPTFLFLENVSGIRTKGLDSVVWELANIGYDCRWITLSAAEVGANHQRKRWWLLAYSNKEKSTRLPRRKEKTFSELRGNSKYVSNSDCKGLERQRPESCGANKELDNFSNQSWWETEPCLGRVVNGLPFRMDRIKGLGNAVVPAQAKEAFMRLLTPPAESKEAHE